MPVTDPIADMITRIRNAVLVGHETTSIPFSKTKHSLLGLMKREGFISGFQIKETDKDRQITVNLRYYNDSESVIHGLKRVSKPGRRVYVRANELPRLYGGIGVAFISSSKGIITDYQARRLSVGGELLFYVW